MRRRNTNSKSTGLNSFGGLTFSKRDHFKNNLRIFKSEAQSPSFIFMTSWRSSIFPVHRHPSGFGLFLFLLRYYERELVFLICFKSFSNNLAHGKSLDPIKMNIYFTEKLRRRTGHDFSIVSLQLRLPPETVSHVT